MKILFLGGDKRYKFMMSKLSKEHSIYQIGFSNLENVHELNISDLKLSDYDIVIFPISGMNDNQEIKSEKGLIYIPSSIFNDITQNILFFTGLKTKQLLSCIPEKQIISFLDFKEVEEVNNSLTVDRCYERYRS